MVRKKKHVIEELLNQLSVIRPFEIDLHPKCALCGRRMRITVAPVAPKTLGQWEALIEPCPCTIRDNCAYSNKM